MNTLPIKQPFNKVQLAPGNALCAALSPGEKHPPVFEETLFNNALTIGLRPVMLPNDLEELERWFYEENTIGKETKLYFSREQLLQLLSQLQASDYAQAFTGLLNNHACFIAEVCAGENVVRWQGDCAHEALPGDFCFRLTMAPPLLRMREIMVAVIHTCLQYFFLHPPVQRVIWEITVKEFHFLNLAGRSGFEPAQIDDWPEKKVHLFTRENFSRLRTS